MAQTTKKTQTHLESFHFLYLISILQFYLYFINNLFKRFSSILCGFYEHPIRNGLAPNQVFNAVPSPPFSAAAELASLRHPRRPARPGSLQGVRRRLNLQWSLRPFRIGVFNGSPHILHPKKGDRQLFILGLKREKRSFLIIVKKVSLP
jgi:hypothetical protein